MRKKAVCPNCRGEHPASYKGCPTYQEAKSIKRIQTTKAISYAEALKTIRNGGNSEHSKSDSVTLEQNKPATSAGDSNNSRNNNPDRAEIILPHPPPNEGITKQVNSYMDNTHKNCVKTELLTDFFQSFTTVLPTGMSFNPDSKELVAKLCQLVDAFLKSINNQTDPTPN